MKNKIINKMTTNHLKTAVESTPEVFCILNEYRQRMMPNVTAA